MTKTNFSGTNGLQHNTIKANQGGTPLFGSTITTEAGGGLNNSGTLIGDYVLGLSYTHYYGTVNDKGKGIFNLNNTTLNGKYDPDVSIDIGKFSYSTGLGSTALSIDGVSINSGISLSDGISFGGSYTNGNNQIQGFEFNINPYKIVPIAAAAAYYTAPYWAPIVLAPIGL